MMLDLPSFSIVTVVKNDLHGFRTTARSISEQHYPEFEWVVIDGDSSDGTKDEITALRSIRHTWVSEVDDGIYDAMNKGVAMTSNDYVIFLNAGDEFESSVTLGNVASSILNSSLVPDVVFGSALLVFQNDGTRLRKPRRVEDTIWHGLPAVHQSTFYRAERIKRRPYDLKIASVVTII